MAYPKDFAMILNKASKIMVAWFVHVSEKWHVNPSDDCMNFFSDIYYHQEIIKYCFLLSGYAWTKSTFPHDWWEVEIAIKVTGRGRLGGDGVVR